ncbi:Imm8 family immunity protein [Nonomuraea indica]|uniref:Imm8 family immunity protein n=1 Tax=Nonomuraea indica TaxID=1581193 RepID=A0ABW8A263_9ACTN
MTERRTQRRSSTPSAHDWTASAGSISTGGRLHRHPFLIGRHRLFAPELHPDTVTAWPADRIAVLEAPMWEELAERMGRIGAFEFEDDD